MKTCTKCGSSGPFNLCMKSADRLNSRCKKCVRAYFNEWKAKNPDKPKEYARANYARNIEQARANRRSYYRCNKARMNERVRENYHADPQTRLEKIQEWKESNPEKVRAMSAKRRAWQVGASGTATDEQIGARVQLFGGMCAYCGWRPYEHLDHAIPLSAGGTNWPANLRPACADCNLSKNRRTWILVCFGDDVGGDCMRPPYAHLFKNSSVTRTPPAWQNPSTRMENREILYRDYHDAIGSAQLERFMLLAQRYKRTEVLRPSRVCCDCGSILERGPRRGMEYCQNGCGDEEIAVSDY